MTTLPRDQMRGEQLLLLRGRGLHARMRRAGIGGLRRVVRIMRAGWRQ